MNKQLIIMRGPSGSGKSTLARHFGGKRKVNWFEADMFFEAEGGQYMFDANRLGAAHAWCRHNVGVSMSAELPLIIQSNTNYRLRDLKDYLDMADEHGYDVQIIRAPGPWDIDTLNARNVHGTPHEIVERQCKLYVEHEDEEEWTDMEIFS